MAEAVPRGNTSPPTSGERITVYWVVLHAGDPGCLLRLPEALSVASGSRVDEVLSRLPGWTADRAQQAFAERAVAVFGVTARADDVLCEGDRIEVLDGLRHDPMESRRRRAVHKASQPRSRRRQPV